MKFKRLIDKFESLIDRADQGSKIKPEKLAKLQQLLEAKKSAYQSKLEATRDPDKYRKLETRLQVVKAQLKKSRNL